MGSLKPVGGDSATKGTSSTCTVRSALVGFEQTEPPGTQIRNPNVYAVKRNVVHIATNWTVNRNCFNSTTESIQREVTRYEREFIRTIVRSCRNE
jgi:hypothetical protein